MISARVSPGGSWNIYGITVTVNAYCVSSVYLDKCLAGFLAKAILAHVNNLHEPTFQIHQTQRDRI